MLRPVADMVVEPVPLVCLKVGRLSAPLQPNFINRFEYKTNVFVYATVYLGPVVRLWSCGTANAKG